MRRMTERFCIYCGYPVPEDSIYCPKCGAEQPRKKGTEKVSSPSRIGERKIAIGIAVIFVIIIVGALGYWFGSEEGGFSPSGGEPSPASFYITDAELNPTDIPVGHKTEIIVTVFNKGDLTGTGTIEVKATKDASIKTVGQERVTIDGGQRKTLSFIFQPDEVGEWKVSVADTTISLELQVRMLVSADELAKEYDANEVAADLKYKDETFYVYGVVDNIGKSLFDEPTVTLDVSGVFNDVHCTFKKSEAEKIAKLSEGDKVLIRGEGEGTALGLWIYMDNCEFVESQ